MRGRIQFFYLVREVVWPEGSCTSFQGAEPGPRVASGLPDTVVGAGVLSLRILLRLLAPDEER